MNLLSASAWPQDQATHHDIRRRTQPEQRIDQSILAVLEEGPLITNHLPEDYQTLLKQIDSL